MERVKDYHVSQNPFTARRRFLYLAVTSAAALTACARRSATPTVTSAALTVIPTAQVNPETPSPIPFVITQFDFQQISPDEIGVNFCTEGRPVGTTLRVRFYKEPNVDPATALEEANKDKWEVIKELGVPCFNTNPANPDWPVWRTNDLIAGTYLVMAEARPEEARGDWNYESVLRELRSYPLKKP